VVRIPLRAVARRSVAIFAAGILVPENVGLHVQRDNRKLHFWSPSSASTWCSFPQHFLGLSGMPRRYVIIPTRLPLELVSSDRSYISGFGVLIFVYGVIDAFVRKQQAADNPWGAGPPHWSGRCRRRRVPSVRGTAARAVVPNKEIGS